jgi:hypothetical protein
MIVGRLLGAIAMRLGVVVCVTMGSATALGVVTRAVTTGAGAEVAVVAGAVAVALAVVVGCCATTGRSPLARTDEAAGVGGAVTAVEVQAVLASAASVRHARMIRRE